MDRPLTQNRDHAPPPSARPKQVQGTLVDETEPLRRQLEHLAWLMDESIQIPGLGVRVGVDGLLGLIPGVGDLISAGISTYIIRVASTLGVPKIVLARMAANTFIDLAIGSIPIVGDIFDIGWKANKRNVKLALQYQQDQKRTTAFSWFTILGLLAIGALASVGLIFLIGSLLAALF